MAHSLQISKVLKLLDMIMIVLEGDHLRCSEHQFAYQERITMRECSRVEWSASFETLINRKEECLFERSLLFIYKNQDAFLFFVYINDLLVQLEKSKLAAKSIAAFMGNLCLLMIFLSYQPTFLDFSCL